MECISSTLEIIQRITCLFRWRLHSSFNDFHSSSRLKVISSFNVQFSPKRDSDSDFFQGLFLRNGRICIACWTWASLNDNRFRESGKEKKWPDPFHGAGLLDVTTKRPSHPFLIFFKHPERPLYISNTRNALKFQKKLSFLILIQITLILI